MIQIRLANITGLDISNAQHSVAIDEALIGISDTEAFIEYCRDKKDGIEYATKTEKLDTLATRYKRLQEQSMLPTGQAEESSTALAQKVEAARVYLKNEIEVGNDKPFSRLKQDGERYFSDKELEALAEIGSSRYLIELSETHELKNALSKLFISKYVKVKKYNALSDGQKKMKKLIGASK